MASREELEIMTVAELRELADDEGILLEATKKAEIIDEILAGSAEPEPSVEGPLPDEEASVEAEVAIEEPPVEEEPPPYEPDYDAVEAAIEEERERTQAHSAMLAEQQAAAEEAAEEEAAAATVVEEGEKELTGVEA